MKVAYIFRNDMSATFQLATMILPQLEQDNHGVEVVGMMFFDDNVYSLSAENEIGKRLSVVANRKNILMMILKLLLLMVMYVILNPKKNL